LGFRFLSAVEGSWHLSIDGCQRGEIKKIQEFYLFVSAGFLFAAEMWFCISTIKSHISTKKFFWGVKVL
jgi:hypothetical protein